MPGAEGNPGKTVSNKENNNDLIQQTKGKQRNYGTLRRLRKQIKM